MYCWAGIAIHGLLSAKVLAMAVALGCSFFKSAGHLIDGIVMVRALVLQVMAGGVACRAACGGEPVEGCEGGGEHVRAQQ